MKSSENLSVSVVVPFYNRSRFLKRLLDSVAAQTFSAEKIYIIDNGSNLEETLSAWKIITEHHLFNRCVFTSSLGSGNANYARNLGYELSETKYVAFLDSDDWWEKDHLAESINCLNKSNKTAVYSGAFIHTKEGVTLGKVTNVNQFNDPFSLILSSEGYIAQTSSYIVNKDILKYKVVWDDNLKRHQDFDYFSSIFYYSSGWCYCTKTNVNIDWDSGGTKSYNLDYGSLQLFYNKWKKEIPREIKKSYLLHMLYLTYALSSDKDIKKFYYQEIASNNFFDSLSYRIKTTKPSIILYIKGVRILDKLRLKNFIKLIFKR